MQPIDKKFKTSVALDDVADFFRSIADQLEGRTGPLTDMPAVDTDFYKLALKCKRRGENVSLTLKAKAPYRPSSTDCAESEPIVDADKGGLKYKHLKKRMKADFKAIGSATASQRLPDPETVRRFLADSDLMITYPGYGDAHYAAYKSACHRLSDAFFIAGDANAVNLAWETLQALKNTCHDSYK